MKNERTVFTPLRGDLVVHKKYGKCYYMGMLHSGRILIELRNFSKGNEFIDRISVQFSELGPYFKDYNKGEH